jgi:HSP20 family molecular chaperone IbpA
MRVGGTEAQTTRKEETVTAMQAVGYHQLPPHARVRETDTQYLVELDVADFTQAELSVEAFGPVLTIRGDQTEISGDDGKPFRIHERLEESFRLPDDADLDGIQIFYKHGVLEIRVARIVLTPHRLRIERRRSGLVNPDAEGV